MRWSGAWFVRTGRERLDCKTHLWRERNKHTRRCVEPTRVQETSRRTAPRPKAWYTPCRTRQVMILSAALHWSRQPGREKERRRWGRCNRENVGSSIGSLLEQAGARERDGERERASERKRKRVRECVRERERVRIRQRSYASTKTVVKFFSWQNSRQKMQNNFARWRRESRPLGNSASSSSTCSWRVRLDWSLHRSHLDREDRRQVLVQSHW